MKMIKKKRQTYNYRLGKQWWCGTKCAVRKKKVWKRRILFVLVFVFVFVFRYMRHATFYEKNIRGIDKGGCKDGFINFKYH